VTEQEPGIADPLPPIPPEWVPLADLPEWIARHYGASVAIAAAELILAVRRGELRHRIPGIKANQSNLYQSQEASTREKGLLRLGKV
jgi:hypothetical protein